METTYQDAEGVRAWFAAESRRYPGSGPVEQLAMDYMSALVALNQLHTQAIRALARGADVSPADILSVTDELL